MDRMGADLFRVREMIQSKLNATPILLQIPIGSGDKFSGIIDLIKMKAMYWKDETLGLEYSYEEIPAEMKADADHWRNVMIEKLSEFDDEMCSKFLDGSEIDEKHLWDVLRKVTVSFSAVPVFCGSAFKNKGVQPLLDAVITLLPSPADRGEITGHDPEKEDKMISFHPKTDEALSALAFKIANDPYAGQLTFVRLYSGNIEVGSTVYNPAKGKRERVSKILLMHSNKREERKNAHAGEIVGLVGLRFTTTGDTLCSEKKPVLLEKIEFPEPVIFIAIEPKTKADEEKLNESLSRLMMEDPTFKVSTDKETGQQIISGMGELHLEIIVDRLLREFKVSAKVGKLQVAYRETVTTVSEALVYFDRELGGKKYFAGVKLEVAPYNGQEVVSVVFNLEQENITTEQKNIITKAIKDSCTSGHLAGYPVYKTQIKIKKVEFVDADSLDVSLPAATSLSFRDAYNSASPVLLEPIMKVEMVAPEEYVGDIIGDIGTRRGRVFEMGIRTDGLRFVMASVPLAGMFGYSTDLRSVTQGRGTYTMEFSEYQAVPLAVSQGIINGINYF